MEGSVTPARSDRADLHKCHDTCNSSKKRLIMAKLHVRECHSERLRCARVDDEEEELRRQGGEQGHAAAGAASKNILARLWVLVCAKGNMQRTSGDRLLCTKAGTALSGLRGQHCS